MTEPTPTSNLGTIRSNLERALQLCHVDGVIYPHILAAWKALESMSPEAPPTPAVDLVVYQPTTCGDLEPIEFEYEKQDADACVLYSDYLKAVARLEKSSGETRAQPKRYDLVPVTSMGEPWLRMEEDATGEWVRWDDVSPPTTSGDKP